MKVYLLQYWDRLHSSFWFVPAMMAAGSVGLVFATVFVDERVVGEWWDKNLSWMYTGGAEGARAVLGTIAGSMMTIAGVVFSMTLIALTLASSQFGPRLLRNFMRDTSTQMALGTFVATFLYCLLVLRTIREAEENGFVPHLSVTLGVLFALVSMGMLIYFIHHVAVSIQADEIISRVSAELIAGIDRMFPEKMGTGEPGIAAAAADIPESFEREARAVVSRRDGYIQFINADALMRVAAQDDLLLLMEQRPGHYVSAGSCLVRVWPGDRVTDELADQINDAIILGNQRTAAQDVEFALSQLVEVAVRALSPGVNDPFTAIRCLDRIGSALCRLAGRVTPSPYRHDKKDKLRVIAPPVTFPAVVDAAFNQIRQNALSNAAVSIRLLETITAVAACARRPEDRAALRRQAEIITRGARSGLPELEDRRDVEDRFQAANRVLNEQASSAPE
jgi:uncharacterized membrane protein